MRARFALGAGALAVTALALAAAPLPTSRPRLLPARGAGAAWILRADGRLQPAGLEGADPAASAQAAGLPVLVDVVIKERTLYGLSPSPDGKTTALLAIDAGSGTELSRWSMRGSGRLLAVTSDQTRACVVGLKPSARDAAEAGDWMLWVVDLASGEVTGTLILGLVPSAVEVLADTGAGEAGSRLFVASRDRVTSYTLAPLRPSWFYLSPGDNLDLVGVDGSLVLFLLRPGQVAVVDPARRPREEGRVQLGADDATGVIALPAAGGALAVGPDGSTVAVLHEDGTAVTWLDAAGGRILETRALPGRHDLMARALRPGTEPGSWTVTTGASASGAVATLALRRPEPPAGPAGAAASPPPAARPVAAPPAAEPKPAPVDVAAPASTPPEPAPPEPAIPQPPAPPAPDPPSEDRPPEDLPEPIPVGAEIPPVEPEPVPEAPAESGQARPSGDPALAGKITGPLPAGVEVRLYGPNNILRLHARAAIGADGAFRLALPSPGSYRVVVTGGAGAHLFTRPEYRTIRVNEDGKGTEGIDFEIRGSL